MNHAQMRMRLRHQRVVSHVLSDVEGFIVTGEGALFGTERQVDGAAIADFSGLQCQVLINRGISSGNCPQMISPEYI